MRLIFQGRLQTFLGKPQPCAPDGLLANLQQLADFRVRFAFIHLQQDMCSLDHNRFVTTFRYDRQEFLPFFFG